MADDTPITTPCTAKLYLRNDKELRDYLQSRYDNYSEDILSIAKRHTLLKLCEDAQDEFNKRVCSNTPVLVESLGNYKEGFKVVEISELNNGVDTPTDFEDTIITEKKGKKEENNSKSKPPSGKNKKRKTNNNNNNNNETESDSSDAEDESSDEFEIKVLDNDDDNDNENESEDFDINKINLKNIGLNKKGEKVLKNVLKMIKKAPRRAQAEIYDKNGGKKKSRRLNTRKDLEDDEDDSSDVC